MQNLLRMLYLSVRKQWKLGRYYRQWMTPRGLFVILCCFVRWPTIKKIRYVLHDITCDHNHQVQVTDDIHLEGSLNARQHARGLFSGAVKRQRIKALLCTQENKLQEQCKEEIIKTYARKKAKENFAYLS